MPNARLPGRPRRFGIGFVLICACLPPAGLAQPADRFALDLNITLSRKAAEKLASSSEGVIASASYYGDPTPEGERHVDEIGQIALGVENVEAPGKPGAVRITGAKVDPAKLKWVKGPVSVNVNVYSARRSGPDNILACDFIDGEVAAAAGKPVTLHCTLIEEGATPGHKP